MDNDRALHWLNGVPYLLFEPVGKESAPWVVIQHGYSGSLETEAPYGRKFAEAGFMALVTEAPGHGQRRTEESDQAFATDFHKTIGLVVEQSVCEIRRLLDHFGVERCGMFGISMGGFITYRLAMEDPRVRLLAPNISGPLAFWAELLPEPERSSVLTHSAYDHPEVLTDRRIFAQNGQSDEVVPPHLSREFAQRLSSAGGHIRLIEYPGQGHEVTDAMTATAIAWFQANSDFLVQ